VRAARLPVPTGRGTLDPGAHMIPTTLRLAQGAFGLWPGWALLLAPLLAVPISLALAALAAAVAGHGLRGLDPAVHWTERARRLFPVRRALVVAGMLAPIATLPLASIGTASPVGAWAFPLTALLSIGSVLPIAFRLENRLVRRCPLGARLRSVAALFLLLAPGYLLLLGVALVPGALAGPARFSAYAVAVVVAMLGGGALLARALGLVRQAPERLRVAAECLRPADRPSRLWAVSILQVNAFALHWLRGVVFSDGALERLDGAQLAAVLAHEVEHLREPLGVRIVTALAAMLLPLGIPALWALGRGRSGIVQLLILDAGLVAMVVVLRLHVRLRRAMELRSDAAGKAVSPVYAAALELVHEANLIPAVLRTRRTHPDLVERLAAAGVEPSWPRPAPPPSVVPALAALVLAAALAFGGAFAGQRALATAPVSGQGAAAGAACGP
jgi:Zn-dependent protease with chaperone function